ncbi:MAG: Ldh family oxidoreductase [Hyphomicrobiales bacterium]
MIYKYEELNRFNESIFRKMGYSEDEARIASEILLASETRGIKSHGLLRLKEYVNLWKTNRLNPNPKFKVINETLSTALVDGDKALGLITAPKAMDLCIEKAKNAGTGWVAVRNSYHFGIAGYYAMKALDHDMIGIAMTNANPLVAPTFSKKPLLGTNPIAIAIPSGKQTPFIADFATAPINRGKLDMLHAIGEQAPDGLIQDKQGNPTVKANILSDGGAILTLGGPTIKGGHKGYCMSASVDILTAVLSGANFGPTVVPTLGYLKMAEGMVDKGIGHFFGAIRIDAFQTAEEFKEQMDEWITTFRNAPPVDGEDKVLIPGDPEREYEAKCKNEGIPLTEATIKVVKELSENLNIDMIK